MRPTRLPKVVNSLIVGTVYHLPKVDDSEILNYLIESMSFIEVNYFGCDVIILDDFNRLNISRLITNFKLKETINFSARGKNMLDLVLANLRKF